MCKIKVEIKPFTNDEGETINALYFDGQPFDWGITEEQWWVSECKDRVTNMRTFYTMRLVLEEIISKELGRPITITELNEAIEKGEI